MSSDGKKIVLVVGDSMALPRPGVAYVETWPYLLSVALGEPFHLIDRSRRGSTTDRLRSEGGGGEAMPTEFPPGADCLEAYAPSAAVVQLGIVDCAPRLIARGSLESRILRHLPRRLREKYLSFVKRHRRRSADRAYVPLDRFRSNVATYLARCEAIGVKSIFLEIAPLGAKYTVANPDADGYRVQYNRALRTLAAQHPHCHVVAPFDTEEVEDCVLEDGYHLNSEGHQRTAQRVSEIVRTV